MKINLNKIKNFKRFLILPIFMITIMFASALVFAGCTFVRSGVEVITESNFTSSNKDLEEWLIKNKLKFYKQILGDKTVIFDNKVREKIKSETDEGLEAKWNNFDQTKKIDFTFSQASTNNDNWLNEELEKSEKIEISFNSILIKMNRTIGSNENLEEELEFNIELGGDKKFEVWIYGDKKIEKFEKYELEISNVSN